MRRQLPMGTRPVVIQIEPALYTTRIALQKKEWGLDGRKQRRFRHHRSLQLGLPELLSRHSWRHEASNDDRDMQDDPRSLRRVFSTEAHLAIQLGRAVHVQRPRRLHR